MVSDDPNSKSHSEKGQPNGSERLRDEYVKHSSDYGYLGYHLPQHRKLIVASSIAPAVSAERGYRSEETRAHVQKLGFGRSQCNVPSLLIPLFNVQGEQLGYQARPDNPRVDAKGRIVKYETPAGQVNAIDVHPRLSRKRPSECPNEADPATWLPALIADPNSPLLITEGSRKADCLVSLGLCCIALLGVWHFRGKNAVGGYTALADWESVALKGRAVYLIFDSDVTTKDSPAKALIRLAAFLKSRGAEVKVIYLPSADGSKVGVDDWVYSLKQAGQDDAAIVAASSDSQKTIFGSLPVNPAPAIGL